MGLTNLITALRIILLPVVIYLVYQNNWNASLLALILFLFIGFTGLLDLRATYKKEDSYTTSLLLDPFSDKIVAVSLLIVLLSIGEFWIFPLLIFIIRDFVINGIRTIGSRVDVVLEDDKMGKVQTIFQYIIVFLILLKIYFIQDGYEATALVENLAFVIDIVTAIAMILALISIIDYAYKCNYAIKNKKQEGQSLEQENLTIIANKKSRGYHDGLRRKLLKLFAKKRKSEIKYISPEEGMFDTLTKEIKKHEQIVIAGGDGSFESALNHKLLQKKTLGFFPLGAGNAYYSYFYKGKKFRYLSSKFKFKVADLDVIKIEWDNGSKYTTFLSVGIDAEVIRLSKKRTSLGLLDYIHGSWKTIVEAKGNYSLAMEIDDNKLCWDTCANLTLTTIPFLGYDFRSVVSKCNNDKKIYGQAVVNKGSRLLNKLLRAWALILSQLRLDYPPIYEFSAKEISIHSEVPFPIQAGGEFLGYSHNLKAKVIRKQKVLVI
jgi:phosphatidylglycerophosphate synthase/diacylglycerol kinase family enzyme